MNTLRITVTLPPRLVEEIDRQETNRSRFIADAVERELERRQREALYESLRNPHAEALEVAETGFDAWAEDLPSEADDLVDPAAGKAIRWHGDLGWSPDQASKNRPGFSEPEPEPEPNQEDKA